MVLQTSNFDNVTGITSKNIKFEAMNAFMTFKKEWKDIVDLINTDDKFSQFMSYEGFGAAAEKSEGSDIQPVDFGEGHKTTTPQKSFAYEVRISWEQRQFAAQNTGFTKTLGFFLGRSGNLRFEYTAAGIFNNGFTDSAAFHGADGKPLFSATHTFKTTSETFSNVLSAADLGKTALESALITVNQANMENNVPAKLAAKSVAIGTENVFVLPELLKSSLDPETANNTYNAIQDFSLKKVLNHFYSDTDGWFILTDESQLAIVQATAPFLETESYPNKDIGENIWVSMNSMFKDPLGTYGNQGA